MRMSLPAFVAILFTASALSAQSAPQAGAPTGSQAPQDTQTYAEHEADLPLWAKDLRRSEIVGFGFLPFGYLLSSLAYDTGRYVYKLATGASDAQTYAPLFFGNGGSIHSSDEIAGIVVASVSLSAVFALVDFFVRKDEEKRQAQKTVIDPSIPGAAEMGARNGGE